MERGSVRMKKRMKKCRCSLRMLLMPTVPGLGDADAQGGTCNDEANS